MGRKTYYVRKLPKSVKGRALRIHGTKNFTRYGYGAVDYIVVKKGVPLPKKKK